MLKIYNDKKIYSHFLSFCIKILRLETLNFKTCLNFVKQFIKKMDEQKIVNICNFDLAVLEAADYVLIYY